MKRQHVRPYIKLCTAPPSPTGLFRMLWSFVRGPYALRPHRWGSTYTMGLDRGVLYLPRWRFGPVAWGFDLVEEKVEEA